jgi:hypothetical protein
MKRSSRHLFLAICIAALALATLGISQAQAKTVASKVTFPEQPHAGELIIKTSIDPNFCLEDTASTAGSPADISQCATRDNQLWTFLQSSDNSIVIADDEGQCLGYEKSVEFGAVVGPCAFNSSEHFLFPNGAIETRSGKQCLTYAKAAQNATVFFEKCVAGQADQTFSLAR